MFTLILCITVVVILGRDNTLKLDDLTVCLTCAPMIFDLILASIIFG